MNKQAPEQKMSLKRLQKRVTASTGLFSSKDNADTFRGKVDDYNVDHFLACEYDVECKSS